MHKICWNIEIKRYTYSKSIVFELAINKEQKQTQKMYVLKSKYDLFVKISCKSTHPKNCQNIKSSNLKLKRNKQQL